MSSLPIRSTSTHPAAATVAGSASTHSWRVVSSVFSASSTICQAIDSRPSGAAAEQLPCSVDDGVEMLRMREQNERFRGEVEPFLWRRADPTAAVSAATAKATAPSGGRSGRGHAKRLERACQARAAIRSTARSAASSRRATAAGLLSSNSAAASAACLVTCVLEHRRRCR